jgi:predicted AAA+ superfamily ATPase
MNYIERKITNKLRDAMKRPEIIVLTGMRRVGKTTVLRMLYNEIEGDNKIFLDFENLLDRRLFDVTDYNQIIQGFKAAGLRSEHDAYVFIDEIQNYPDSVKPLKYLHDHYSIKFVITGSSSFYLKNLFPESLAGRKLIYEMYPLDFEEFLLFKNVQVHFEPLFDQKAVKKNIFLHEKLANFVSEYIEWGGFPQVALESETEYKKRVIADIFSSYYQKDILQLSDFRNMNAFRDLLMLLIPRTGSKLEISKLASETGISRDTVYSYLSFLQATYMISLIKPFSNNIDKEISGSRKLYFCDNGILSVFGKLSEGSLLENAVFNQLKNFEKVNYFQKRNGHEIDFILPETETALEVKTRWNEIDFNKAYKTAEGLGLMKTYMISLNYNAHSNCIPFEML